MNFQTLSLPNGLHVRPSSGSDEPFLIELYKSTRNDLDLIDAETDFIEHFKESQFKAQTESYEEMFPNAINPNLN